MRVRYFIRKAVFVGTKIVFTVQQVKRKLSEIHEYVQDGFKRTKTALDGLQGGTEKFAMAYQELILVQKGSFKNDIRS